MKLRIFVLLYAVTVMLPVVGAVKCCQPKQGPPAWYVMLATVDSLEALRVDAEIFRHTPASRTHIHRKAVAPATMELLLRAADCSNSAPDFRLVVSFHQWCAYALCRPLLIDSIPVVFVVTRRQRGDRFPPAGHRALNLRANRNNVNTL